MRLSGGDGEQDKPLVFIPLSYMCPCFDAARYIDEMCMKIMNWQEHAKGRGSGEEEFYVNACCDESSADLIWSAAPVLNDACPPARLYPRCKLWPESF